MIRPIFLHSLFRSGSTYFFDKLRIDSHCWCYYEPFHHVIAKLRPDDIDIWSHSAEKSNKMNHPSLSRPHFYEYSVCFNSEDDVIGHFDKKLSYDRFCAGIEDDFEPEKKYIDHLICSTPDKLTPVLQFNRSTFRLDALVKYYPDAEHIYLVRNPRNQFQSYVSSGMVFLAINLLIASRLSRVGHSLPVKVRFFEDDNIDREIRYYLSQVAFIKIVDHYKLFFYLWSRSYLNAIDSGCSIINVDNVEKEKLSEFFLEKIAANVDFSDYKAHNRSGFLLTRKETEISENRVFRDLNHMLDHSDFIDKLPLEFCHRESNFGFDIKHRLDYHRVILKGVAQRGYIRIKYIVFTFIRSKLKYQFRLIAKSKNLLRLINWWRKRLIKLFVDHH